jgi:hypothetical protein
MGDEATAVEDLKVELPDGPVEMVERERTIFVAEDPDAGPYYRYNAETGENEKRPPVTGEFLAAAALNSDPAEGRIVNEFGLKDYAPQIAVGHEDDKKLLLSKNLPSAGGTRGFRYDSETGELKWRYGMHPEIAKFEEQGLFPNVSARFVPNFTPDGHEDGIGPAVAHIAMYGTNPVVKKNLGPWSDAIGRDFAEVATVAKKAGARVVDFGGSEGSVVLDFAEEGEEETKTEETGPAMLRARLKEKAEADAERGIEFMITDIAGMAAVEPELVRMFVEGEVDQVPEEVTVAIAQYVGVPKAKVKGTTDGDEGDADGDETPPPTKPEGDDEEKEANEDFAEGENMSKPKKTEKKPAPKVTGDAPTAQDFAEQAQKIRDLTFIVEQQGKKLQAGAANTSRHEAELAKARREGRKATIMEFAERMSSTNRYPGPGRKAQLVAHLEKVGTAEERVLDFAEGETQDALKREMEFIEAIAPPAVDGSGQMISAGSVTAESRDEADLAQDFAEYKDHMARCEADGHPSTMKFSHFVLSQGYSKQAIIDFSEKHKLATHWADSNVPKG